MKLVMKFGGTSLADGERMLRSAQLLERYLKEHRIAVVASAMDNVTDVLIELAEGAKNGYKEKVGSLLETLRKRHIEAVNYAIKEEERRAKTLSRVEELMGELKRLVNAVDALRELTARVRDQILSFGERLSATIFKEILVDRGIDAEYFTGGEAGIITDDSFGEASPLLDMSRLKIFARLEPLLKEGKVPVVTGFTGITQHGEITTLGRGGSDYTATILAVSLNADEVWLWSDVDGILSADPKLVKEARVLPTVSYEEAFEMAVFGAKAMHPRALEPVAAQGIPVRVKNTFNPDAQGTLITHRRYVKAKSVVKTVALVRDVGTINIAGGGMVGRPGTAAKIFDVLGRNGVNVLMISQSVSEADITLVVKRDVLQKAVTLLEIALLGKGLVRNISFEDDVCVIAVLGAGMKGTYGVAARVFKAVAERGINVGMIAQGSSELSISFVVKEIDGVDAVRAIHKEFRLDEQIL